MISDNCPISCLGIVLPWYIIEVTLEKQSHTEFRAEDGIVYERMHGTTVQRLGQAGLARTRCDRCGEVGHMARVCPRPPTCFSCGEAGHQAFRCPRGAGHKVVTTPVTNSLTANTISGFT